MKHIGLVLLALMVFVSGCATQSEKVAVSLHKPYYDQIQVELDKVWRAIVKQKFDQLYADGLDVAERKPKTESWVRVRVAPDGRVIEASLQKSSGVRPVDEAAVEAFTTLAKLPPPPQELLKENVAQFRWNFVLEN